MCVIHIYLELPKPAFLPGILVLNLITPRNQVNQKMPGILFHSEWKQA